MLIIKDLEWSRLVVCEKQNKREINQKQKKILIYSNQYIAYVHSPTLSLPLNIERNIDFSLGIYLQGLCCAVLCFFIVSTFNIVFKEIIMLREQKLVLDEKQKLPNQ